jgi:hypothetical protein
MERKLLFEDIVLFGGYFLSGDNLKERFWDTLPNESEYIFFNIIIFIK